MARPPQPIDPKRRTRLLATARVVFATHGFTNARLTDILRESDFPRSSFYYFFHTKDQLFDTAFADGLRELAGYVTVPVVDKLTRNTFWPALTNIIAGMTAAATRPDLTAVGTMFHLADKPHSPNLTEFEHAIDNWTARMVDRGLRLGLLDPTIPPRLHVDLAYAVATRLDAWALRHPDAPMADLASTLLPRMLGNPTTPHDKE